MNSRYDWTELNRCINWGKKYLCTILLYSNSPLLILLINFLSLFSVVTSESITTSNIASLLLVNNKWLDAVIFSCLLIWLSLLCIKAPSKAGLKFGIEDPSAFLITALEVSPDKIASACDKFLIQSSAAETVIN
mgnify:CR=1 FL=1